MTRQTALVVLVVFSTILVGGVATATPTPAETPNATGTQNATMVPTDTATPTPTVTPTATSTPTPSDEEFQERVNWTPTGPYELTALRESGRSIPETEPSTRALPGGGALWFTHSNPGGGSDNNPLDAGVTIKDTRLKVTAWRPGDSAEKTYTLHIVYFRANTKLLTDGDRSVPVEYAANQTHATKELTLDRYKTTANLSLKGYYDDPAGMTMWLSDGDARVATWPTYRIDTIPTAEPISIANWGAFWKTIFSTFGWAVLLGLPIAFVAGRKTLATVKTGINYSGFGWAFIGLMGAAFVWFIYWFQAATLLRQFPWLPGVGITLLVYLGYIEMTGPGIETATFEQKDLERTTPITDDSETVTKARFRERIDKDIIRSEGRVYFVERGVLSFIARVWEEPAWISEGDIETMERCEGDADWYFEVDPIQVDEAIQHEQTGLTFDPQVTRPLSEDRTAAYEARYQQLAESDSTADGVRAIGLGLSRWLERLNPYFLVPAIPVGALCYLIAMDATGLVSVAVVAGLFPGAVASIQPTGSDVTTKFAPMHFYPAEALRSLDTERYLEASTLSELEDALANDDFEKIEQIQQTIEEMRNRYRKRYDDMFGPSEIDPSAPAEGSADD